MLKTKHLFKKIKKMFCLNYFNRNYKVYFLFLFIFKGRVFGVRNCVNLLISCV